MDFSLCLSLIQNFLIIVILSLISKLVIMKENLINVIYVQMDMHQIGKGGYVKLIMFYDPNQQYEKQKILIKK